MTLTEIKALLAGEPTGAQLEELARDDRAGVRKLLASYHSRQARALQERERYDALLALERQYLALPGVQYVAGLDEAGRGPLAGPLVIAGVILPPDGDAAFLPGLNDSKSCPRSGGRPCIRASWSRPWRSWSMSSALPTSIGKTSTTPRRRGWSKS